MSATDHVSAPPPPYESFTLLLDDPAELPQLGFEVYAGAFAQIIEHSSPHFAVGLFGDWGSGKTTLMRAIERWVAAKPDLMLPVWFNAWRYEREVHLIVPLLDNLREVLEWRSTACEADAHDAESPARRAAAGFGRAAKALLRGLSIQGGPPGVQFVLDAGKIIESAGADGQADEGPASFYHAAFTEMREATAEFVDGGRRRIVVFIDDLDRCLPANALQVLESMKLFFDFVGFVFVVGLDQGVIERSVEAKYREDGWQPAQAADGAVVSDDGAERHAPALGPVGGARAAPPPPINGGDYIKKLFQLPFSLPRLGVNQLGELLDALSGADTLPAAQAEDLKRTVLPHLRYMSDRDVLNAREVKRLVNVYVLQVKLLQPRMGPSLSPDTVLTIQLMGFRPDWRPLYEVLLDDPDGFAEEVSQGLEQNEDMPFSVGEEEEPVPQSFVTYVRQQGIALLRQPSLVPYVSSAEQSDTLDRQPRLALQAVRRLRKLLPRTADDTNALDPKLALPDVRELHRIVSESSRSSHPSAGADAMALVDSLELAVGGLATVEVPSERAAHLTSCMAILERLGTTIREMRRQTSAPLP